MTAAIPTSRRLAIPAGPITSLAYCPRRELLAVGQYRRETQEHPTLSLWSTATWQKFDSVERKGDVLAACFTSNSSHLVYSMGDALVPYDLEHLAKQPLDTDLERITTIKASPSSSRVAVSGNHVEVWDISTRERVWRLDAPPTPRDAPTVELRRDQTVVMAGHSREVVEEIDLGSGSRSTLFTPGSAAATCSSIGCDDRVFALVSRAPHADYLWDMTTGERILPELFGERFGGSTSLCVHPTKRLVATGSFVGYVSLQDLDRGGAFVWSEQLHRSMVSAVVIAGDVVVAGSHDGTVSITEIS